jgi:hypothetical protein
MQLTNMKDLILHRLKKVPKSNSFSFYRFFFCVSKSEDIKAICFAAHKRRKGSKRVITNSTG